MNFNIQFIELVIKYLFINSFKTSRANTGMDFYTQINDNPREFVYFHFEMIYR